MARPALVVLMSLFALTLFLLPGIGYLLITPLVLSFETEKKPEADSCYLWDRVHPWGNWIIRLARKSPPHGWHNGLNQVIWQVKSAPEMQGRLFALMGTLAVGGGTGAGGRQRPVERHRHRGAGALAVGTGRQPEPGRRRRPRRAEGSAPPPTPS